MPSPREPGPGAGTLDGFSQMRVYFARGENHSLKRALSRLKIPKDDTGARANLGGPSLAEA